MLRLGMFLGDRYEILEQIGSGGMSDVYKGKDHKLNRFVAIKVLKNEYSNDKNFVSKFRIEAQSAAGLAHPNIVNVYDVGEEEGIHYIVMELVEGITLKNYIHKKGKLSVKEAISIAIQMSMGIEAAHNNHIIHRDIKPQNIIISRDGKVKVTDFGIARAASSNTISSNVMGSVHYTSPEQARGGYSDEKSDIYSLGITIYEMLTGRVPFDGENTVAVAIKHIQDEMDSPRIYSPEIPISLEKIVFKCTQKRADRRYTNMTEVISDLKQSLINPEEDFVKIVPEENYEKTIMITDDERGKIKNEAGKIGYDNRKKEIPVKKIEEDEELYEEGDEEEDLEDSEDMNPTLEKIMNVLGIVAAIIIACIALYIAAKALGVFNGFGSSASKKDKVKQTTEQEATEQVEMIKIVGKTLEEAKKELNAIGLGIKDSSYENSDIYESGYVIAQDVEEGKKIDKNTTINVTVSTGEKTFELPDVAGQDSNQAIKTLESQYELKVTTDEDYSQSVAKGNVISTTPSAGTSVKKGSEVKVIVSRGKKINEVEVPDIIEMSEAAAKSAIKSAGLSVGTITSVYSAKIAEGYVVTQGYKKGDLVDEGTAVDFTVSMGPETDTSNEQYIGTIRIEKSDLPEEFTEGTLRLDLTQNGKTKTVVEEDVSSSEFPYTRQITGESGVTTGTVKMYIDGVAVDGTFTITFSE
ncbi:Stk1 family PASTA domain-containing Ser/Thr kinase [Candidatus Galacturonibacter soehngenii]|uniref:non-specific serine/threonine protein kinase n=1 Tax=Candidatus Galacturonatibacter soehngenii TaxID=2307010 RepID=A0A7V7QPN2_9FIRM|nr:Stk1 family PASTA domain-containing Ser/Thr kinase [Candidatus Galacturonibacter soehngenii]KAB1440713.1 Stk1 family PASTA domain-containing Ser/Thr kinase [Candidatus Galacturonibacter soehngenii]